MPVNDRRLRRTAHVEDTFAMPAYASLADWQRRASVIKQQVLFAAGLFPLPDRTPLNPIVTGKTERDGYTIENVAFESFPGFFCTGNLYRPTHPTDPARIPVVLTPHGHWQEGRFAQRDTGSVPARCINFARQGYLTFSPDMVGYNDSRQIGNHRTFDSDELALWGIGTLGLQLWNNIRALDYLLSLPGADPQRVACTGESGGATQTYLLTAVDDRVTAAAPVNMLSAHYAGGCVCENAPGLRHDLTNMEIVAAFAPKPQLIVAATGDWTVNTPHVEYPAVRSIYELYGAADALECVQFDAPHNYNVASRQAVYGFLARHFGGRGEPAPAHSSTVFDAMRSTPIAETPDSAIEDVTPLRVFPDALPPTALGGPRAVADAAKSFFSVALPRPAPADSADSRAAFTRRVRPAYELAFGATLPAAGDLVLARREPIEAGDLTGERFVLGTRRLGEQLPAVILRPVGDSGAIPVLLLHPDGARAWLTDPDQFPATESLTPAIRELLAGRHAVLMLDLFLTGRYLAPVSRVGRPSTDSHFTTYNRTDTALRVQDILTAAAALAHLTGATQIDVVAAGEAAWWALLARPLAGALIARIDTGAPLTPPSDQTYFNDLYVPHLLRLGGLETAAAVADRSS